MRKGLEWIVAAHPAWGVVHGEPIPWLNADELLFLSFVQIGQYFCQSGGGVRTFTTAAGGIVFSMEVPHGLSPILKWLHPPHYAY